MKLLAFDTSTELLSIALCDGARQWQHQGAGGAQASATLLPMVRQLLAEASLALTTLDAIVFGSGPGSFTGLRTACAVAQGLAYGAQRPVLAIDTLLATAEDARQRHGCTEVVVALDARMGEIYTACYIWQGQQANSPGNPDIPQWQAQGELQLCTPEALQVPAGWTVAGNAQAAYGTRLAPAALHVAALPQAAALLRLAPALLTQGLAVPAEQALPRYIRDKVAQTTAERMAERASKTP